MERRPEPVSFESLDAAVDFMLARIEGPLHLGAPLGLGKPHRLLNALYARVEREPLRRLHLYTALSLDPPAVGGTGLEARFLGPFVERHFGADFPRLTYAQAMKQDRLPAHIEVEEFYFQSGALLGSTQAQRRYASLNYTHVAKALVDRGMNVLVQKVARKASGTRLSLSCNTDLTFDALDAIAAAGLPRPLLVAEVDPELPWLGGDAVVDAAFFDAVLTPPGPHPKLFALPRQPVSDIDYAIGFHASTLVKDGGTLQIGIGALADALCHALALRHIDNAAYQRVLAALDPVTGGPGLAGRDDLGTFASGLYGCSEMINEGFKRLVECGVIRRKVSEDEALMRRIVDGTADDADRAMLERGGQFLHGAFYLGSHDFYDWLRNLSDDEQRGIGMKRVGEVNELYGGNETLERLQRRDARFFNTCMMATALGAAVSDALDDGRVVSGVGGQYNFVAMAHALHDARSVLMLRATRGTGAAMRSSIVWNYGHTTIPRHLRDVAITEYGVADMRDRTDGECADAMLALADAAHRPALAAAARAAGKLPPGHRPADAPRNRRDALARRLRPLRASGVLPDYPQGCDFTPVEQRLVRALAWLKGATATRGAKLRTLAAALASTAPRDEASRARDAEALARMELAAPASFGERLEARLLRLALARTVAHDRTGPQEPR